MRLSIPGKIFAGFVALLMTFGAVSGHATWKVRALGRLVGQIHGTLLPLPAVIAEIKNDLRVLDMVIEQRDRALLRRSVHVAQHVHRSLDRLAKDFGRALALLRADDAIAETRSLARRFAEQDQERVRLTQTLERFFERVDGEGDITVIQRRAHHDVRDLVRELARFEIALSGVVDNAVLEFEREERRTVWASIILVSTVMVLGIVITASAGRTLRPLRTLREGVERIARGEYAEPVQVNTRDELGALAADFNRMAEAIRHRDEQLGAQQKELLHRERLATVGRMSSQITHELRNPLSSIGLNSELLMEELERFASDDVVREAKVDTGEMVTLLESIIAEVGRLRDITEEYLRFGRLPRPEPVPTDLNHAARELLDFVHEEMNQRDVKTRLDADPAARPALVDPNQLRAALINLLRNAREALTSVGGGHIVLRARTLGEHATLEVCDSGPGMSSQALEHMFEPFFSTKPQGTGLGLSMVRKIVEAQAGEVEVESSDQGTTVRLKLPLAPESPALNSRPNRAGLRRETS